MGWKQWVRENVEDGTEIGTWDGGGDRGWCEIDTEQYSDEISDAVLRELGYEGFDGNWSTSGTVTVSGGTLVLEGDETDSDSSVESGDEEEYRIKLSPELTAAIIEVVCPQQMHGSECDNAVGRLEDDKTKELLPFIYLIIADGPQPEDLLEVNEKLRDICLEIAKDGQARDCGGGDDGPFSHMDISNEVVESEGGHVLKIVVQAYDDECTHIDRTIELYGDEEDDDDDDDEDDDDEDDDEDEDDESEVDDE